MAQLRAAPLLPLLAALAACSDSPTAADSDPDGDGFLGTADQCPTQPETINNVFDLDGCPDTPTDLYEFARADVEAYWEDVLAVDGLTYSPISTFVGYTGPSNSPCGPLAANNAFYCSVNAGVYYHEPFLLDFLNGIGDAAPAFVVAHEIGHHIGIGHLTWVPGINLTTKQSELGADCFGGAWLASADERGLLEEGDLQEVAETMLAIGDPAWTWFDPNQHGTVQQRASAVGLGYSNGPSACLPTPGGISGFIFYDTDGDGAWDTAEPGWENVPVTVTDVFGNSQTVTTSSSGEWTVFSLPVGVAVVDVNDELMPTGIVQTFGMDPELVFVISGFTYVSGYDGYHLP